MGIGRSRLVVYIVALLAGGAGIGCRRRAATTGGQVADAGAASAVERHLDELLRKAYGERGAGSQQALETLRRDGASAVELIKARFAKTPGARYLDRWALVHTLELLAHPAATNFLSDLLRQPLPAGAPAPSPEHALPSGGGGAPTDGGAIPSLACPILTPLDAERQVRFAALRGLGLLASLGHAPASRALLDLMGAPADPVVKAEAVHVFHRFARNTEEGDQRIREALPAAERSLLDDELAAARAR
jgi:hypothetical protein